MNLKSYLSNYPKLKNGLIKIRNMVRIIYWPRDYLYCLIKGVRWDNSWTFFDRPIFSQHKSGQIQIGRKFIACSDPKRNSLGIIQPVIIRATTPTAKVIIGDNVGVSGCSICARDLVKIGDNVLIGTGVIITDSDAHPIHPDHRYDSTKLVAKSVIIQNNVFIGGRAIILKGVTIGNGAVVGAGAIVTKSIPDYGIAVGNPARVVGDSRNA